MYKNHFFLLLPLSYGILSSKAQELHLKTRYAFHLEVPSTQHKEKKPKSCDDSR